jgi:hypothetical protein
MWALVVVREVRCTTSIVCFRPRTSIIVLASSGTRWPMGFVDTHSRVVVGVLLGYRSPKRPSMQCSVTLRAIRSRQQASVVSSSESSSRAPVGVTGQFHIGTVPVSSKMCSFVARSMNSMRAERGTMPASCCSQVFKGGGVTMGGIASITGKGWAGVGEKLESKIQQKC